MLATVVAMVDHEPGYGIDRTQMRELLKLTYAQRLARLTADAAGLAALEQAVRKVEINDSERSGA